MIRSYIFIFLALFLIEKNLFAETQIIQGLKFEELKMNAKKAFSATTDVIVIDEFSALVLKNSSFNFINLKSSQLARPMTLPKDCSRVALVLRVGRSAKDILCFGSKAKTGDTLFVYSGAGKFTPLLRTPKKIFAAGGSSDRILFISGDGLFQIRLGDAVRPVFVSSLLTGVKSLVLDSENDVVYLSTDKEIMSLRGGVLDVLVQGAGGALSLLEKDIVVVSASGQAMRLSGLNKLLVMRAK